MPLTHFDDQGASRMVDVSTKNSTDRFARAEATVVMSPETMELIQGRGHEKGDVLEVARIAGIMATKRTSDLIPLCHPLAIASVQVDLHPISEKQLRIESRVSLTGQTGVEMEALTAVSVAALTVYDMCKAVDRGMTIGPVQLLEKSGGKSGHFLRSDTADNCIEDSGGD